VERNQRYKSIFDFETFIYNKLGKLALKERVLVALKTLIRHWAFYLDLEAEKCVPSPK